MSVFRQGKGDRGSLKWIQVLVNDRPEIFDSAIRREFGVPEEIEIEWVSPLESRGYEEYRDEDFLDVLGLSSLNAKLSEFWPKGGPQWDALGRLSDGTSLLVEAKAHISEVLSQSQASSFKSIKLIEESLERTKKDLGVGVRNPWTSPFYQYANRIAHLHFLKNMNGVKSYLVFVNFVGDGDVGGPKDRLEWIGANRLIHSYLGISRADLKRNMGDVYIDVRDLA